MWQKHQKKKWGQLHSNLVHQHNCKKPIRKSSLTTFKKIIYHKKENLFQECKDSLIFENQEMQFTILTENT